MPDYKEMYLRMMDASEKAINLLITAQQECEEMYLSEKEPELKIFSSFSKEAENAEEL